MVGANIALIENNNIVDETPALAGLYLWVFLIKAPEHIDNPGSNKTAPKIEPIIEPSTNEPLCWFNATQYRKISTIVEKNALITAPTPIEDWALMEATAWPMK